MITLVETLKVKYVVVSMGLCHFDKIIISNVICYEKDGIPKKGKVNLSNSSNWCG